MATTPDATGDVDLTGDPRGASARPVMRAAAAPRRAPRRAPLLVAAVAAAGWAAIVSFLPVFAFALLAQAGAAPGVGRVLRLAAAGWLLGHGVPVPVGPTEISSTQISPVPISLVPLAVTGLALWRLTRAGVHTARAIRARASARRAAFVVALAVGLTYGVLGTLVAVGVGASPARGAATLGLLAALAAGLGAMGYSRTGRALLRRAPVLTRDALRTGISATAFVLGVGAAAAGAALAIRGGDAASMLASYHAGVAGQAGITVLCLAFAPNLAVWGAAYLLGPGFAFGVGTVVSPGLVAVGPAPSVPILAALPTGAVSGPGSVLLGIPLVAAMAAGVLLARRRPAVGWAGLLGGAALAGPVAGLLLGGAAVASAGALGPDRLGEIGPSGWSVGLWGALVVAVGATIGALAARALHRSEAAPARVD